jgi:hypothetical protein
VGRAVERLSVARKALNTLEELALAVAIFSRIGQHVDIIESWLRAMEQGLSGEQL